MAKEQQEKHKASGTTTADPNCGTYMTLKSLFKSQFGTPAISHQKNSQSQEEY